MAGTNSMPDAVPAKARLGTRVALAGGFGGLLTLMAVAGIDSIRVLRQAQTSNALIQADFLAREGRLEQIRSALYESATVVRDYILFDPGHEATLALRADLDRIRAETDSLLPRLAGSPRPEEWASVSKLQSAIQGYWALLDPVFEWDAEDKRQRGYWFLRQELFPRRTTVLDIAREISALNKRALDERQRRITDIFERFRQRLQILLGIALGLGLAVAGISTVYILRLERDVERRYRESVLAQGELKELSARLVDVQEQERHTISRELHDEVGQSLSALLMDASRAAAAAPAGDGAFRQSLENIKKLAEDSVQAIRNMALLLRPSMLDDLGLAPALHWQAREVSKRTGMVVDLNDEDVADDLPEDHKTCLYRVVQEALHNCARHAAAKHVRIVLRQERDRLCLTIQDDGRGFDARRVRGLGLLGMAERVAHLGGTFGVESKLEQGTLLKIELPLAGSPAVTAEAK